VLDRDVLLTELQRFADPSADVFAGWPIDRVDARRKWAHAYAVYVDDAEDVEPVLTPHPVTIDFTGVEPAFFETLTLVNATVEEAALDFARAWRAAIVALAFGATAAESPGDPVFSFELMEPLLEVAPRFAALEAQLVVVFRRHRGSRRADLEEIADAFHAATVDLRSTATPFRVRYA
jgi:hypothetical protein